LPSGRASFRQETIDTGGFRVTLACPLFRRRSSASVRADPPPIHYIFERRRTGLIWDVRPPGLPATKILTGRRRTASATLSRTGGGIEWLPTKRHRNELQSVSVRAPTLRPTRVSRSAQAMAVGARSSPAARTTSHRRAQATAPMWGRRAWLMKP